MNMNLLSAHAFDIESGSATAYLEDRSMHPYRCLGCGTEYSAPGGYCYVKCGKYGLIHPAHFRPVETLWRGDIVVPVGQFTRPAAAVKLPPYDIAVGRRFVGIFYGLPNSGKTTMMVKIAEALDVVVLYVSVEQGDSDSIRSRMNSLEVCREGFLVGLCTDVASIDKAVVEHRVKVVLIDSLTKSTLTTSDLVALSRDRDVSVIASAQVNSAGDIRGGYEPKHDADLVVRVENLEWQIEKTRFSGGETSGKVT